MVVATSALGSRNQTSSEGGWKIAAYEGIFQLTAIGLAVAIRQPATG